MLIDERWSVAMPTWVQYFFPSFYNSSQFRWFRYIVGEKTLHLGWCFGGKRVGTATTGAHSKTASIYSPHSTHTLTVTTLRKQVMLIEFMVDMILVAHLLILLASQLGCDDGNDVTSNNPISPKVPLK